MYLPSLVFVKIKEVNINKASKTVLMKVSCDYYTNIFLKYSLTFKEQYFFFSIYCVSSR